MESDYCYPEIAYLRSYASNSVMSRAVVMLLNFYYRHLKGCTPKILSKDKDFVHYRGKNFVYYRGKKANIKGKIKVIKLVIKKFLLNSRRNKNELENFYW